MGVKKKQREPRGNEHLGRFVICPGSGPNHAHGELVACETLLGPNKFFFNCGECKGRMFFNTWERDYGYTLVEVEAMGCKINGLSPKRRRQLLADLGLQEVRQQVHPSYPILPPLPRPPAQLVPTRPPPRRKKTG